MLPSPGVAMAGTACAASGTCRFVGNVARSQLQGLCWAASSLHLCPGLSHVLACSRHRSCLAQHVLFLARKLGDAWPMLSPPGQALTAVSCRRLSQAGAAPALAAGAHPGGASAGRLGGPAGHMSWC